MRREVVRRRIAIRYDGGGNLWGVSVADECGVSGAPASAAALGSKARHTLRHMKHLRHTPPAQCWPLGLLGDMYEGIYVLWKCTIHTRCRSIGFGL